MHCHPSDLSRSEAREDALRLGHTSLGASQIYPRPQNNLVGKLGLGGLSPENTIFRTGPIKLSVRALYDDGQMINRNVINHVTK